MELFWRNSEEILARLASARRLLVTLDFDGTLAALAETPGRARLEPGFRKALRALASAPGVFVFILSGRALAGLRGLAGLENIYYGGNHGIEIEGPGFAWRDAGAVRAKGRVADLAADIRERFPPGTGVLVEDKIFSASVHYRGLKTAYRRGFFGRMKAVMAAQSAGLYWRRGHKVFELLPRDAAHKGNAVARLAARLRRPFCVAVGDDLTDEDMFRAVRERGISVKVGRKTGSAAAYFLRGQAEVLRLLRFVSEARG